MSDNNVKPNGTSRIEDLRKVLSERPNNARITAQLSCLLFQESKKVVEGSNTTVVAAAAEALLREEGLALAYKATELQPTKPFGYSALSIVHPDFDRRMEYLQQAIGRSTEVKHAFARTGLLVRLLLEPRERETNLLREEKKKGNNDTSKIGSSSPKHPSRRDLNVQEEQVYQQLCQTLEEVSNNDRNPQQSSDFLPNPSEILAGYHHRLGQFFRKRNPPDKHQPRSKHHFTKCYELLPSSHSKHQMAKFFLATLQEENDNNNTTLTRCPPEYIVGLYSTFADRFDTLLVESLQYRTPTELRLLVDQVLLLQPTKKLSASTTTMTKGVDLGCGSGLSGVAFRELVGYLKGVDLSPQMIEKAKERNCYDDLVVGECISVLEDGQADLDLIVACDVFVYLGDLTDLFRAAHSSLTANTGIFAFSTELLLEDKEKSSSSSKQVDYVLHSCARFAHTKSYIERLALQFDFTICAYQVSCIRKNQGKDVKGQLVALKKEDR